MKRQKLRKLLLIISLLLFPVTLYYFSPALIINAGLNGIINGSFIVFVLLFFFLSHLEDYFVHIYVRQADYKKVLFWLMKSSPNRGGEILLSIPSVLFGRRIFCHYFCWMAPFMVVGTTLRKLLHMPGVHIRSREKNKCISCGKCNKACPMSVDIMNEIKNKVIGNLECIQCGACIYNCPEKVLDYGMIERKENDNGK